MARVRRSGIEYSLAGLSICGLCASYFNLLNLPRPSPAARPSRSPRELTVSGRRDPADPVTLPVVFQIVSDRDAVINPLLDSIEYIEMRHSRRDKFLRVLDTGMQ